MAGERALTRCKRCGLKAGQYPRWLCRACDRAAGTYAPPPPPVPRPCVRCGAPPAPREKLCARCLRAAVTDAGARAGAERTPPPVRRERVVDRWVFDVMWDGSRPRRSPS